MSDPTPTPSAERGEKMIERRVPIPESMYEAIRAACSNRNITVTGFIVEGTRQLLAKVTAEPVKLTAEAEAWLTRLATSQPPSAERVAALEAVAEAARAVHNGAIPLRGPDTPDGRLARALATLDEHA